MDTEEEEDALQEVSEGIPINLDQESIHPFKGLLKSLYWPGTELKDFFKEYDVIYSVFLKTGILNNPFLTHIIWFVGFIKQSCKFSSHINSHSQ